MKFKPTQRTMLFANPTGAKSVSSRRRHCGGFTLAEVLAALMFMAIVIPVAVEGIRIAHRAGQLAERKAEAARVAERVLNESIVTSQWQQASARGTSQEGRHQYRWQIRNENWEKDSLRQLSVLVTFDVQGQEHEVRLTTLADSTDVASSTESTTTSATGRIN